MQLDITMILVLHVYAKNNCIRDSEEEGRSIYGLGVSDMNF